MSQAAPHTPADKAEPTPEVPPQRLPRHVAVIMDGNGRWAEERGLERTDGHRAGVDAVRKIVRAARDLGVSWLTLFAFSSENWNRPQSEVDELMKLPEEFFASELPDAIEIVIAVKGQTKSNTGCVEKSGIF